MPIRLIGLLCGGLLLLSAGAAQAARPFKVSIRVEGKVRTLVEERRVTVADAPIIRDGNPDHSCDGQAAIGALHAGTGGKWKGTWYEGIGYSVDSIMGKKPKAPAYFQLWVNHRLSPVGVCDAALEPDDEVLMFVQDCEYVPALGDCRNPVTPLGVRTPDRVRRGKVTTVRVVDYAANGKTTPEPGATVYVNGRRIGKTDKAGEITVKATRAGTARVHATKPGHARSETDEIQIVRK